MVFRGEGGRGVNLGTRIRTNGEGAFRNCSALTSITFPASLTSIANAVHNPSWGTITGAFAGCSNLQEVIFDNSPAIIGSHAFRNLHNLRRVDFGNNIRQIETHAFVFCTSLNTLTIPGSVTSIGNEAFRDSYHWNNFTGLRTVIIEEGVRTIGASAFDGCGFLTRIEIPESVTSIGDHALRGCTNVTVYTLLGSFAADYAIARGIPVRYIESRASTLEVSLSTSTPPDHLNLQFTVYNQTKSAEITDFVYQFPK